MQIVSNGDNLHEMSKPVFWEKNQKKNISVCHLLKILPSMLSVTGVWVCGDYHIKISLYPV